MATEERTGEPILKIRHLTKEFQLKSGLPFVKGPVLHAVTDVNLDLYEGETLGIIGESGCGKSTLGRTVTMLHKATSGTVEFEGRNIFELKGKELTDLRKDVQMVFQDPFSSLDPRLTCGDLIAEPLIVHGLMPDKKERDAFVLSLMKEVGLDVQHVNRFPHEFSGGQRQRIGIARALVMEPEFIVADEPISALDVSIRAQVLNLLNEMKKSRGLTYLFIAHDLSVVRFISDRIAVISKGRIVELAEAEELFLHPLHPYTKALLSAVPIPDPSLEKHKKLLVYDPSIHDYSVDKPVWEEIANGHFVYGNQRELEGYRKEYESQL